ncbi:TonB-dependent siderophore receptor [Granulicella cerasi]|uniref:TonB-dependent siderophore receptor n=1 Tax=Granulicella cerasi TaxID=741063 RepID=A0ABW1Z992_9BACT|nr:TonB-dependent siderophore receptor [Granulicella cerasi]
MFNRFQASQVGALAAALLLASPVFAATPAAPAAELPCQVQEAGSATTSTVLITDNTGAAIPRASVTVRCGAYTVSVVADASGAATLRTKPGQYNVSISAAGFTTLNQPLNLPATNAKLALNVGSSTDMVNVTADATFVPYSTNTGSKTDTPIAEMPVTINMVSQHELEVRNPSTLNEALHYTPGMQTDEYGTEPRFDWMKIRGFTADAVGVFRDNMRWNSLAGKMDPYEIETIEVVKGPSSVLYGQAPPGGLVNFTTKRPATETRREIQAQFGAYDRRQIAIDLTGPFAKANPHLFYRLEGLIRNSGTQTNYTPDNRRLIAPSLTWRPSDRTNVTLFGDYQHDRTAWSQFLPAVGTLYPNANGGFLPVSTFLGEPGWEYVKRDQASAGYFADHLFENGIDLHQNYRFQHMNVAARTVYGIGFDGTSTTNVARYAYTYPQSNDIHTMDTRAIKRITTKNWQHTFLAGYDYGWLGTKVNSSYGQASDINAYNPVYGAPGAIPSNLAVLSNYWLLGQQHGGYLQDQVKFRERLIITLGGREDWALTDYTSYPTAYTTTKSYEHQNDSKFTGRAGVMYLTSFGLSPYYSYSTSFQPTTQSGTDVNGKLFKPQTGNQHEAGVKFQPKSWSSYATFSFFNILQNNVLATDPTNPLYNTQIGQARSRGIELEAVGAVGHGLNVHAGYSVVATNVTQTSSLTPTYLNKWLPQVPKNSVSALADYARPNGRFKGLGGNFGVRFTGASYGDAANTIRIPNFTLMDASLRYRWRWMDLQVNATNIANTRYVATCSGLAYCAYGSARNVIGQAKYHF